MDALYLAPPHGKFVGDGRKLSIAQGTTVRDLQGEWMLVTGTDDGNALGTVQIGPRETIPIADFDSRFDEHRVTPKERERWWPDAQELFLFPIAGFSPFDEPRTVEVPSGAQTVMRDVQFKSKEVAMPWKVFKRGDEFCVYRVGEDNKPVGDSYGCHETEEKARNQQKALYAAEGRGEIKEGAPVQLPLIDSDATLSPFGAAVVDRIAEKVLAAGALFAVDEYSEEEKALGEQYGEKAKWTRAYINKLPDSAFLYIEPGGKKDDEGKTVPRDLRHLPYKSMEGSVDLPHLRSALSRLKQPKTGTEAGERWLTESLRKRLFATAQKLLAGQKEKSLIERVRAKVTDTVSDILAKAVSASQGTLVPLQSAVKVIEHDGETYIVTHTMNAFEDREGEIFTTKSIEDYVERHKDESVKGVLMYRHWEPTAFGSIIHQQLVGRCLIEVGKFDDTPTGHAFKAAFAQYPDGHPTVAPAGWGCSHKFQFRPGDRDDAVYEWFEKQETSVLPIHVAANPYTSMEVTAMKANTTELSALLGEEKADEIISGVSNLSQWLQGRVRHKESEEPAPVEPTEELVEVPETPVEPTEEEAVEPVEGETEETTETEETEEVEGVSAETVVAIANEVAKVLTESLQFDALSEVIAKQEKVIATLTKQVDGMQTRLEEIEKADETRIAEKEQALPRFSQFSWFRASEAETTKLGENDPLHAVAAQVPNAVSRLVEQGRNR